MPPPESPTRPQPASQAPLTVVLVDDDAAVRERIGQAVAADAELQLLACLPDGRSALDFLARQAPDVLLVDLGLPDLSGTALVQACAQQHPGTDIMVLTVFSDAPEVMRCFQLGAGGYLLKDSLHDEIASLIKQLRAGGAPMTPSIARLVLQQLRPQGAAAAPAEAAEPPLSLTPTEHDVLQLLARGFKYAEIAELKRVSVHTIHSHIRNIYGKLSVNSRGEAVFEAGRLGLLQAWTPPERR